MATEQTVHDTIIIGAGPAGLQLAYYLEKTGREYLVLDGASKAGSYFEQFPRHRKLLSINKVYTGRTDPEFNLRHDWNSLLTEPGDEMLFKNYSQEYFPSADTLVDYLHDFSERFGLKISYSTRVKRIDRPAGSKLFEIQSADGRHLHCRRLVVATGMSKPFIPDIPGIEHAEGYETVSINPQDFAGKTVLILGKGNSALETANHLMAHAAIIHVSSPNPIRFAWETHFVGHLRAVNTVFMDSYLLKSQNGVLDGKTLDIRKDERGKFIVRWSSSHTDVKEEIEQMEYDRVLRCTGFRFDDAIFSENCRPALRSCGRLPEMTGSWESSNIPGLYFAGTLMQTLDYKRSQSSFIHGFRSNIRTLHNMLEAKDYAVPFPSESIELDPSVLAESIIDRANTCCSLWQQVNFLCDMLVLPPNRSGAATWYKDLNAKYIAESKWGRDPSSEYYTVSMSYGPCPGNSTIFNHDHVHAPPSELVCGDLTTEIHPVIRRFRGCELEAEYHVRTDFLTDWGSDFYRSPLEEFFDQDLNGKKLAPLKKPERRVLVRNAEMRLAEVSLDGKPIQESRLGEPRVSHVRELAGPPAKTARRIAGA